MDRRQLLLHWLVFFAIVLACSLGVGFLAQIVLYKFGLLFGALFQMISFTDGLRTLPIIVFDGSFVIELFFAGFLYYLLIEPDYRKAGVIVWMIFDALHIALHWAPAEATPLSTIVSPLFYWGAGMGLLAAIYGAWLANEYRNHEKIRMLVEGLLGALGL